MIQENGRRAHGLPTFSARCLYDIIALSDECQVLIIEMISCECLSLVLLLVFSLPSTHWQIKQTITSGLLDSSSLEMKEKTIATISRGSMVESSKHVLMLLLFIVHYRTGQKKQTAALSSPNYPISVIIGEYSSLSNLTRADNSVVCGFFCSYPLKWKENYGILFFFP